MSTRTMENPKIVSREEWLVARGNLLAKEKELTRERDAVAAERRRMPWMAVEKAYEFEGPQGKVSLLDLFEGRRQLIVYRAFRRSMSFCGAREAYASVVSRTFRWARWAT